MKHRIARIVTAIAVLAACAALPATASDIIKCVGKDGVTTYQNFPCDQNAGWLPSSVPTGKSPAPQAATARLDKASTAGTGRPATLRAGMTADEVKALLGEPQEMEEDEPRSGRVFIWRYADGRLVQFDVKHRLLPPEQ